MARSIGRWKIINQLREGGQAHTFVVVHSESSMDADSARYVLKRLKNPDRVARFQREMDILTRLDHPNVLKLVDFGDDQGRPYFVSEYCQGGDLENNIERVTGTVEAAINCFLEVCDGVAFAHSNGIIHRDIKPSNVFLRSPNGPFVLGDFGISWIEGSDQLTSTTEAAGPRLYIAPELEDGRFEQVRATADVYSLGKLLYWLLSSGRQFSREKHREARWDLVDVSGNPRLERFNRLLDHMVVYEPSGRINSVEAVAKLARQYGELMAKNYNVVGGPVPQPCMYCGIGHYREATAAQAVRGALNLGMGNKPDLEVLACDHCGHLQTFVPSLGKDWARDGV